MKSLILKQAASLAAAILVLHAGIRAARAQDGSDLTPAQIIAKTRAAYGALTSYADSGTAAMEVGGQKLALAFETRLARSGAYRIRWKQTSGLSGTVWSDGTAHHFQVADDSGSGSPAVLAALRASGITQPGRALTRPTRAAALGEAAGLSYTAATAVPSVFFQENCGDAFIYPAISGAGSFHKKANAVLNTVDCYVLSAEVDLSKTPGAVKPGKETVTLWIGRGDFLIRQSRTCYVETPDEPAGDRQVDEASVKALKLQNKPATPEAVAAMRPQMRAILKQVQGTLKVGVVTTQTHDNIAMNQALPVADFAP